MPDSLDQLLKSADAPVHAARSVRDLASTVRRKHARRKGIRRGAIAAVVLLAGSILAMSLRPRAHQMVATPSPQPEVSNAMLALQADLHEQTAERLMGSRSRPRVAKAPAAPEADIQYQRDRAALMIVYEADRTAKSDRSSAIASYRRAIELFPQTHWAAVARERLKDIPS